MIAKKSLTDVAVSIIFIVSNRYDMARHGRLRNEGSFVFVVDVPFLIICRQYMKCNLVFFSQEFATGEVKKIYSVDS